MVKVLGELKALVIKGEDCLKEGQHLKRSQEKTDTICLSEESASERETHN